MDDNGKPTFSPTSLTIADAARLLTRGGGQPVTIEMIESDLAAGAPANRRHDRRGGGRRNRTSISAARRMVGRDDRVIDLGKFPAATPVLPTLAHVASGRAGLDVAATPRWRRRSELAFPNNPKWTQGLGCVHHRGGNARNWVRESTPVAGRLGASAPDEDELPVVAPLPQGVEVGVTTRRT